MARSLKGFGALFLLRLTIESHKNRKNPVADFYFYL